jgi:hypothetical protein
VRTFVKIILVGALLFILAICVGIGWIFFYSRDLPDMKAIAQFAPANSGHVSDPCLVGVSVAISYDSIGENLRAALSAAEIGEDDLGVLSDSFQAFCGSDEPSQDHTLVADLPHDVLFAV